ncbi:hypothetical protein BpHYR1_042503 [Brachionus plicatilis]|uniref:Uncharacterized protein n=1 Tax=Brachionus plicatilis TaxID=10195 RepID=A0A3M7SXB5_BRAPC|nr:hypothetical protein BpHYR1_042503 [Brachionus plicatilis]
MPFKVSNKLASFQKFDVEMNKDHTFLKHLSDTSSQPAQNFSLSPSNYHTQPAQNEAKSPIVCSVRQMSQEAPILFQDDKSQNLKKRGPSQQKPRLKPKRPHKCTVNLLMKQILFDGNKFI